MTCPLFESLDYLAQGPCLVFRDPGQRLAIYERVRPGIDETFDGRFDT
jgi:hypothetical protein